MEVIKTHSNFVNFPIRVEGEVVNTVQAVWTNMPNEVAEEDHMAFYKFLTGSFDDPTYRLHFRSDAPLDLKVGGCSRFGGLDLRRRIVMWGVGKLL